MPSGYTNGKRLASIGTRNSAKYASDTSAGPWKSWKIRTRHGRAIKFIETYCRPPVAPIGDPFIKRTKQERRPLTLATFQKEFLEAALADGVDLAVLQTPRGNGKSSLGGALATWAVFDDDETGAPQVPIIATTVGQAIRSCYGVAASMITSEPELLRRCIIYTGIATPRVRVEYNDGEMFPISNLPEGLQGLNPSFALVDEIGFQPQVSWESVRLAAGKRGRSLIMGVGTPGLDRANALFTLREAVRERGTIPGVVFHEYAAPLDADIDDPRSWREANPALKAGFLRQSALETDRASGVPEGHFRIFRLGQWWDGVDSWLGPDARRIWDDLAVEGKPLLEAPTWVGVDVGLKRDSTAVVMVQRGADEKLHAWSHFWQPANDQPVDVTDVMQHIRELGKLYRLAAISFDPRLFDIPAAMLADDGLPMVEIPQSVERMTPICGSLFELIKSGGLRHDGEPGLTTHVLNAVPRFNERGFTLPKAKSRGGITGAIALALAVDRAQHAEPAPVWSYDTNSKIDFIG